MLTLGNICSSQEEISHLTLFVNGKSSDAKSPLPPFTRGRSEINHHDEENNEIGSSTSQYTLMLLYRDHLASYIREGKCSERSRVK